MPQATQITQAEYAQLKEQLEAAKTRLRDAQATKAQAHMISGDPDMHEDVGAEEGYRLILLWSSEVERLERILAESVVVEAPTEQTEVVRVGYRVSLIVDGVSMEKVIGGPQARLDKGQISNSSKLGQAILGQTVGALVSYESLTGTVHVEILSIGLP